MVAHIAVEAFMKIAVGIDRPEDVVVGRDGRVFASDHQCAVAEIHPDGSFTRMGPKGGAPNGINMDLKGRVLIANFGIYDREEGPLQRFDPATGVHEPGPRVYTTTAPGTPPPTTATAPTARVDPSPATASATAALVRRELFIDRSIGFLGPLAPCPDAIMGIEP
jgi:hypothetical protein